jgi:hypothetical protein
MGGLRYLLDTKILSALAIIPGRDEILCRSGDIVVAYPGKDVPGHSVVADELVADKDSLGDCRCNRASSAAATTTSIFVCATPRPTPEEAASLSIG